MSGQKRMRTKATVQRKLAGERKSNDRSKSSSRHKPRDASVDTGAHFAEGRLSDRLHSLAHQPKPGNGANPTQAPLSNRNGSSLHADNRLVHGAEPSPFDSIASSVIALMVLAARPEAAQGARHQNTVVAKAALARLISTRFSDDD
jgi:hypothetical protein